MNTFTDALEIIDTENEGWCNHCNRFTTVYTAVIHWGSIPGQIVDTCARCAEMALAS